MAEHPRSNISNEAMIRKRVNVKSSSRDVEWRVNH